MVKGSLVFSSKWVQKITQNWHLVAEPGSATMQTNSLVIAFVVDRCSFSIRLNMDTTGHYTQRDTERERENLIPDLVPFSAG